MNTVLITGCSSGFGLETAKYFASNGWDVIATMRKPRPELFDGMENIKVVALDVTDEANIAAVFKQVERIDVLVNNAGVGGMNSLEGMSSETIRTIFEANTFGTIAMVCAVLPVMRKQGYGVIINISSSTTLMPLPYLSIYSASKAAVTQFTESLAIELQPFGIRAHVVIPGYAPSTSFSSNAKQRAGNSGIPEPYQVAIEKFRSELASQPNEYFTHASDVAKAVWAAATDAQAPLKIPAGADAVALSKTGPA